MELLECKNCVFFESRMKCNRKSICWNYIEKSEKTTNKFVEDSIRRIEENKNKQPLLLGIEKYKSNYKEDKPTYESGYLLSKFGKL